MIQARRCGQVRASRNTGRRNRRICSCVMFLAQRPMNDRKIEQDWLGVALVGNKFSPIPSKISFHMKKRWLVTVRNLQSNKSFLTLKLSQYRKSDSTFPHASLSRPAATAANSEQRCVCARPSDPPKLRRSAAPRALSLILQSKSSIFLWNSLGSDCQSEMTGRG